ncbi:hypothetical protein F2Q70_00005405 [Brassica cretica]|uniref:HIT domain-containing protein n=1 Tax=Brassica cretica TaxID=69181 RepID=A0A8S9J2J7_BRACR|nr:hypothetical protein F2Q70_00005405 [Brassica cretica]
MVNTWIQSLTRVKQTKHLTLRHQPGHMYHGGCIEFPPNSFTYPRLTSLSLHGYVLRTSHSFNNCQNLKTLKLSCILASDLGVFNSVLASYPSLEVLVLDISCFKESGPLKIDNKRLKLLQVLETKKIDGIQVSSTRLDSLAIGRLSCGKDDFVLRCPRLRFYRNVWLAGLCYNISQEEKNSGHEEFVVTTSDLFRYFPTASLSARDGDKKDDDQVYVLSSKEKIGDRNSSSQATSTNSKERAMAACHQMFLMDFGKDGPQAGQSVPHVHIHVLPRKGGDFEKNDEIYDAIDEKEKELKQKLDLDKDRVDRTIEEMANEASQYRSLFDC